MPPVVPDAALRGVLVTAVAAFERLEQPAAPLFRGREVEREAGVGVLEAAVHVAVPHRRVAPLVDVDERGPEVRSRPCVCPLHLGGESAERFTHILADFRRAAAGHGSRFGGRVGT